MLDVDAIGCIRCSHPIDAENLHPAWIKLDHSFSATMRDSATTLLAYLNSVTSAMASCPGSKAKAWMRSERKGNCNV